jgi:hypothetical protein
VTIESDDDRALPAALAAIAGIGFGAAAGDGEDDTDTDDIDDLDDLDAADDDAEVRGVDFEPYDEFLDAEDTADWFRGWTGNPDVDGGEYRIFGQDGAGGYAALWLARDDQPLAEQPVVFFGAEGTTGVVACDLAAFLWLLADGSGPMEAVEYPGRRARPHPEFRAVAEKYAGGVPRSAREVIADAREEFPDFEDEIAELCR